MKTFLIFLFLLIGIFFPTYAQGLLEGDEPNPEYMVEQEKTYANLPLPSEILIVYNANVDSSEIVANYYQQARNIPSINICPLTDLPTYVDYGQDGGAYLVNWYYDSTNFYNYLAEDGEVILSWIPPNSSGKSHWLYYKDYIETPIKDYMDENNLTDDIRYIVLIKGLPYRLSPAANTSRKGASVCALLSLMNQPDDRDILTLYNTPYYHSLGYYTNPYLSVDYPPSLDYRFKSGHFVNAGGWYLNYLVSRLDGDTYVNAIDLIDRITSTDKSGEKKWILDNDPNLTYSTMSLASDRLEELGFNYIYDNTNDKIISDEDEVIGYTSHGVHSGFGTYYILNDLEFEYSNGAIFNSWESGNALSYGKWHWTHGLLSDFIVMSGSGGGGNVNEPLGSGIYKEGHSYPAYAMGYSIVDAIYQGINYIAWQNDVIGDPLQTIAWGKQTLTDDLEWTKTNLVTGEINVPTDYSITLDDDAIVNFRHDGFIIGDGFVYTETNDYTLSVIDWEKSVFRSAENNHPKIIWGAHPDAPLVDGYKIYRNFESSGYELIGEVNASTFYFIDEYMDLVDEVSEEPKNVQYYITALLEVGAGTEESDPSNVIDYWVEKASKINITKNETEINYFLSQNYPNPFNPITTLKYSLQEDGLVNIKVYNILGSEVAELVSGRKTAGEYSVTFDFSNLASGTYFYVLRVNDFVSVKKMILLK